MDIKDRIYEVSVSSSSPKLNDIKDSIILETVRAGSFPSDMDRTGLERPDSSSQIKEYIESIDIFVPILDPYFSDIIDGGDKSYTNLAYEYAKEVDKPIITLILEEDKIAGESDPCYKYDVFETIKKKISMEADGNVRFRIPFTHQPNLLEIRTSYARYLQICITRLNGKGGWVRGVLHDKMIRLDTEVSCNPFFQKFAKHLSAYNVLSNRCSEGVPELKKAIAEYFWEQYFGYMINKGVRNFFFESGSSIAYVSEAFIEKYPKDHPFWKNDKSKNIRIQTNNILTYLDFVLSIPIDIELFPYGTPEPRYGATLGSLMKEVWLPPPDEPETFWLTDNDANDSIENISKELKKRYGQNGIIFMAISGIDVSSSQFPGPHVGSYYNMLFKKAILAASCPTIVFLDETKLPQEFKLKKCYPICGTDKKWEDICRENPIGIAIALSGKNSDEEIKKKVSIFSRWGLVHTTVGSINDNYAIVAINDALKSLVIK